MKAKLLGFLFMITPSKHLPVFAQAYEKEIHKICHETADKNLLIYGEASHGLQSNHEFACTLFKHLVQNCGYRVLFLEVPPQINDTFQQFASTGQTIHPFYLNAFNTPQVNSLLEWLKNYNTSHPEDPVYVCGFQPEQPVSDVNAIKEATGKVPATIDSLFSYDTDLDLIIHNSRQMKEKKVIYSPSIRKQLNEELSSIPINAKTQLSVESLSGYINVLSYWIDHMTTGEYPMEECSRRLYQEGDSVRMNLFYYQKNGLFKQQKAFLWMHNWHAMKNSDRAYGVIENGLPPKNTLSLGYRISREYNSAYFLGTVSPPKKEEDRSVSGSIDQLMLKSFGNCVKFIPLNNSEEKYKGTLSSPNDRSLLYHVTLHEQFDGIIYLPNQ